MHGGPCRVLFVLGGISCDEIIVSWLTRRDLRVMVMIAGIKSDSERMRGGRPVLRSWMMDGHKGGGADSWAEVPQAADFNNEVRRAADFNYSDVRRFRYRGDRLLIRGDSDSCSSYL